jgi:hypothetical protein
MTTAIVARASLVTSLTRYARSWGLWLLLIAGPVGARFMVARDDGSGIQIAVGRHLPVITSSVLGVSLGIIVSALLLPIGFLYLRSNVTRRQPWQVEEVTAASRMGIALGRFAADAIVLLGMLATLTVAGWFLGWLIVPGPLDVVRITWPLWLIAAPSLLGLAAVSRLLDAVPATRRGLGDFVFFVLWMASITMPAAVADLPSSLTSNLYDFPGYVRPLVGPAPLQGQDFMVGSSNDILPGRVSLDVMAGIEAPGYVASRAVWTLASLAIAVLAGLLHRPHVRPRPGRIGPMLTRLVTSGAPPAVTSDAPAASLVAAPLPALVIGEFLLIGAGRPFKLFAVCAGLVGVAGDYRHIGSPAALLLLIFALVAHAGRSESLGLLSLTRTAALGPWTRRAAFVAAGCGWGILLALPAAVVRLSPDPLLLTVAAAAVASSVAIGLATMSHSAFAARLSLLIMWYAFLST